MPVSGKVSWKLKVVLLTNESVILTYDKTTTVEEIHHEICDILELNEREMFGIAVLSDPSEKLKGIDFDYLSLSKSFGKLGRKVVPKFRRRAQTTFFGPTPPDVALQSYRTVYFRVRFYIPLHCLRERDTQHLYYEQLRTNLLEYGLYCDLATYLELAALALQAEYGNAPTDCLDEELNGQTIPVYFDPEGIYPHQMLQEYSREGLLRMTFRRHMALQDMPRRSAEFHFIRLGSKRTSNFNKHLYKLAPMSQSNFTVWLGVSPDGIELHQQIKSGWISPTSLILWRDIYCISQKERVLIVHLYARKTVRKFQFEHGLSSKHMFALVSHMHFFQLRAELSAPYSAGLLEHIERGYYEERYL
ncbi:hypothetical protein T265_09080 [Opisthorchis viverrini]|uniref:FERM domain-containing protein n=1 Tax=Opisthorchis viverrini TaxID=6198 RepID=A0A074ZBE7_OPIVI|nr:hypothetical protein T265_09080 [Opisthorchis viverrini]KER22907.1 hypothetical protein T265_09080 [Opisthorchis viverrini]